MIGFFWVRVEIICIFILIRTTYSYNFIKKQCPSPRPTRMWTSNYLLILFVACTCTSLLTKHNDFVVLVFYSFAISLFVVVAIFLILRRDLKPSIIGVFCGEVLSTSQRWGNDRTNAYTGIFACPMHCFLGNWSNL